MWCNNDGPVLMSHELGGRVDLALALKTENWNLTIISNTDKIKKPLPQRTGPNIMDYDILEY